MNLETLAIAFVLGVLLGVSLIIGIDASITKRTQPSIPYAHVLPCAEKGVSR